MSGTDIETEPEEERAHRGSAPLLAISFLMAATMVLGAWFLLWFVCSASSLDYAPPPDLSLEELLEEARRPPSVVALDAEGWPRNGRRVTLVQRFRLGAWKRGPKTLLVIVPREWRERQQVLATRFSREPAEDETVGEVRYATFRWRNERIEDELVIESDLIVHDNGLGGGIPRALELDPAERERFTRPERFFESDDPVIAAMAREIEAGDELEAVVALHARVVALLRPGPNDEGGGAREALLGSRAGDCQDYTDLLVALCRARGIPARSIEGVGIDPDWVADYPWHAWAEVFIAGRGWVAFDPRDADDFRGRVTANTTGYVRLSDLRFDPRLDGGHYWICPGSDAEFPEHEIAVREGR